MLLTRKELMEIAEPEENDIVRQSRLLDPKSSKCDYKILLKRCNFKEKPGFNFVIISTNEERNPMFRFRITPKELKKLFEEAKPIKGGETDYITFLVKDNIPTLYIPGQEPNRKDSKIIEL